MKKGDTVKHTGTLALLVAVVAFLTLSECATTAPTRDESPTLKYGIKGKFDSKFHSDGTMDFRLFSDGTLEGDWVTDNKSITLKALGYWIWKNGSVIMSASGLSMVRSTIKTRVIIFGYGKLEGEQGSGEFSIVIDDPRFPNDTGTWNGTVEEASRR